MPRKKLNKAEIKNILAAGWAARRSQVLKRQAAKNKKAQAWVDREKQILQTATDVREFLTLTRNDSYRPPHLKDRLP